LQKRKENEAEKQSFLSAKCVRISDGICMVFGRGKSKDEELIQQQGEYQIANQAVYNDAVLQQIRRDYGTETFIVKDEWLDQILLDLAFNLKTENDGNNIRVESVKNHFFAGLYFLHSSISQTSWIDKYTAAYMKALARRELFKEYLRIKLNDGISVEEKSRIYSLLKLLEAYFTMVIESAVDGRRVQALKVEPRVIRTEIARRKGKTENKGLW
jgi:hypothetical protein